MHGRTRVPGPRAAAPIPPTASRGRLCERGREFCGRGSAGAWERRERERERERRWLPRSGFWSGFASCSSSLKSGTSFSDLFFSRTPRAYVFSNCFSSCWLIFLANFERPVLGCIDAKFCK